MKHADARAAVAALSAASFRVVIGNDGVNTARGIAPDSKRWTLRVFWTPEDERGVAVRSLAEARRMIEKRLEQQRSGGAQE